MRDLSALSLDQMHAHAHPLLAAWGRQSRDFVRQLDEFDDVQQAQARFAIPRVDLFDEDEDNDAPLLSQVQQRIRDLTPMGEHPRLAVPGSDRSIVFHAAHSMMREVEVLHDQLLQLFADTASVPWFRCSRVTWW
jgi:exodeoxyribonuclease V gamma subunit